MERYVLQTSAATIQEVFGVQVHSEALLEPNYNAAPGHSLPVIYEKEGKKHIERAIWGEESGKEATISLSDAQVLQEMLAQKNTRFCIIPINGFYAWKETVSDPLPFFVRIHTRELLGIAGFLTVNNGSRNTFTVCTRDANVLIQPLTKIMPCILTPTNFNTWLDGDRTQLLKEGFKDNSLLPEMTVFRVPDLVNDLSNNSKELIQPIPKLRDED